MNPHQTHRKPSRAALARLAALAVTALFAAPGLSSGTGTNNSGRPVFRNLRAQTEQFIDYFSSIRLTPAQEAIKGEALDSIPAPCCKKFSMKTCCCPCNLAKSVWGLSNYLIAKKGYGAPEVRSAVVEWLAFTNPKGFTGDACFTGGCKRRTAQNGCAGMDATHVIVGDDVQ
jgi:hypothetical protein